MVRGELDRLYVAAADRLASGARLMLLYEEFQGHGIQVVFLKGDVDGSPEGKLLLHMQGAFAEYERTKIAERTRRGKLYWARQGAMVGGMHPMATGSSGVQMQPGHGLKSTSSRPPWSRRCIGRSSKSRGAPGS